MQRLRAVAESPEEWAKMKKAVAFYLEDASLTLATPTVSWVDDPPIGFVAVVPDHSAMRAQDILALSGLALIVTRDPYTVAEAPKPEPPKKNKRRSGIKVKVSGPILNERKD